MSAHGANAQATNPVKESRTEKVAIAVTASEKRAVQVVAGIHETDESNLCRSRPIHDIVAEFNRLRSSAGAARDDQ